MYRPISLENVGFTLPEIIIIKKVHKNKAKCLEIEYLYYHDFIISYKFIISIFWDFFKLFILKAFLYWVKQKILLGDAIYR